jgi:hypothetical protein
MPEGMAACFSGGSFHLFNLSLQRIDLFLLGIDLRLLLNYPNSSDIRMGKRGSDIMIHTIKNTTYLGRDSTQGCVTMAEDYLKEI